MPRPLPEPVLRDEGIEVTYSTGQVASMFGKTRQWVLHYHHIGGWVDGKGKPVVPGQDERGRYIWQPDDVKNIAVVCYKRRTLTMDELKRVIRRLLRDQSHLDNRFPTEEPDE